MRILSIHTYFDLIINSTVKRHYNYFRPFIKNLLGDHFIGSLQTHFGMTPKYVPRAQSERTKIGPMNMYEQGDVTSSIPDCFETTGT